MFGADSSPQDIVHLAIETTGRLGSVAVLRGQRVIRQTNLDPNRRTAATLAPEVQDSLRWCQETHQVPAFVSVADGPGSFTGLRIGVTTAKTLGYALDLPLVSVDSLAAISAAAMFDRPQLDEMWVVLDAYRRQLFVGQFTRSQLLPSIDEIAADWTTHPPTVQVLPEDAWWTMLAEMPAEIRLAGDDKPLHALTADPNRQISFTRVERECDAVGVGSLGLRAAILGRFIDPLTLVPRYLKVSAAEEKLIERG